MGNDREVLWTAARPAPLSAGACEKRRGARRSPKHSSVLLLIVTILLTSCSRNESKTVRLRFWGVGHEGEVVGSLMSEFERRNPGIRVDVQQIPWTAAHEKLLTAFVGSATPDVAQMGNTWIPEFVSIHALDDLSARLPRSSVSQANYFPGIWATNEIDGTLYGVPWYVDTRVLFYRRDLLERAGVARAPKTWSEWLDAMARVKAKGEARFAILLPTNEWEEPTILALQQRSPLLRDGGRYGAFRQPEFARAFTFYVDLFRRGYAPAVSNNQVANVYQGFEQGDFAMYITGPWNVGEFRSRLSPTMNGKWATAPMPAPDGMPGPGTSLAGGSSLVIFRNSKNPDAAWRLIEFLSEPEQQMKFFELTRDLPAHRDAWKARELIDDPAIAAFREQLEHVEPLPRVPEWEQIATSIYEVGETAIRGGVPIPRALAALDRRADHILEKRRWVLAREGR